MCPDQVELRHLLESLQQMQAGWQQTEAAARAQLLADKESSDKEWAGPRGDKDPLPLQTCPRLSWDTAPCARPVEPRAQAAPVRPGAALSSVEARRGLLSWARLAPRQGARCNRQVDC